jgi:single-strand DNA-binding protein
LAGIIWIKERKEIMALNHITLMGRICNDIELRRTNTGVAVTSFTLAVDRDFKSGSGEKETDFVDVVCWKNTAEFVEKYFGKGRMAVVSGRLQGRSWTDKDGNKRKTLEAVADNVYFGDSKKEESSGNYGGYNSPANPPVQDFETLDGDDASLPF